MLAEQHTSQCEPNNVTGDSLQTRSPAAGVWHQQDVFANAAMPEELVCSRWLGLRSCCLL